MGLFDRVRQRLRLTEGSVAVVTSKTPGTVFSPTPGTIVPLCQTPDPAFSEGMLGQGCGIRPDAGVVYAPVDGVVAFTTETNHAIGFTSDDGIEVLIHIGIDTVEMKGRGFARRVEANERVRSGAPVMTFSREEIAAAGYDDMVFCVVANTDSFSAVTLEAEGHVEAGSDLIRVSR